MENYFRDLLQASVLCGGFILLIAFVSPMLKKSHTVFWRYTLWMLLSIRLIFPFHVSLSGLTVTLPFTMESGSESFDSQQAGGAAAGDIQAGGAPEGAKAADAALKDAKSAEHSTKDYGEKALSNEYSAHGQKPVYDREPASAEESVTAGEPATAGRSASAWKTAISSAADRLYAGGLYRRLFDLWAAVTSLLLIWHAASYCIFCCNMKKTCRYLYQKENIPVYVSDMVSTPGLTGIWRPRIILPKQDYTPEQLAFILSHELTHYNRRDLLAKSLLAGARILHWFNPLVYYMEKRASKDIELLCDIQVVREFSKEEKKRYGQMLLACASAQGRKAGVLCVGGFSDSTRALRERFSNLFTSAGKRKGVVPALLGAVTVLFVSLFVVTAHHGDRSSDASVADKQNTSDVQNVSNVQKDPALSDAQQDKDLPAAQQPVSTSDRESSEDTQLPVWQELSIEDAAAASYGAVFPQLVYASSQRAILYDYWGLMIYDVKEEKIDQLLDLPAAGMGFVQGDAAVHIEASKDGRQLLLYKESQAEDRYLYEIDEKRLVPTDRKQFGEDGYDGLVWQKEVQYALTDAGEAAHLSADSLRTKDGEEFHSQTMEGICLVYSDYSAGKARFYPLFKEYYESKGEAAFDFCQMGDVSRRVLSKEFLYEDEEGWQYFAEADQRGESRISKSSGLLLVRYRDGERQVLEDLMTQDMYHSCPVIFSQGRIVYQAAANADIMSRKRPVLVSIALDGSDRRTADDILYHVTDNVCEDQGWIYYAGWTNDGTFPRPLCRIPADFSQGAQFVEDLNGLLAGVEDGYVYYLADHTKKPGIYMRNLKSGEERLYDKWGVSAEQISYFNSREYSAADNGYTGGASLGSSFIFEYWDQEGCCTVDVRFPAGFDR